MKDILFLAHRVPFPPDRGDKIRSFHVLRHLTKRARVHLVAFAEERADFDPPAEFRDMLASCTIVPRVTSKPRAAVAALLSGRPVSLAAFADRRFAAAVARVLVDKPAAIYAFSGQVAQYLPVGGPPVVMDFVDVDSAKFAEFGEGRGPFAWLMRREARLLGAFERGVAANVSASLFVSDAEAALFRDGGGAGRIVTVENGIDADVFDPDGDFEPIPLTVRAERSRSPTIPGEVPFDFAQGEREEGRAPLIVFTGQMDYRPNIEAVQWFAADILPRIRERHPAARFAIVGRAPTAAVQALASDAVIVTGAVDDVRGWLAAASVCVAPLKLARGIQNKVLEAMAMARPIVASDAAAEGIDHDGTIGVAGDAADFAARVTGLLDDRAAAEAMGVAARAQVIRRYGWDARLAPLDDLLGLAA